MLRLAKEDPGELQLRLPDLMLHALARSKNSYYFYFLHSVRRYQSLKGLITSENPAAMLKQLIDCENIQDQLMGNALCKMCSDR